MKKRMRKTLEKIDRVFGPVFVKHAFLTTITFFMAATSSMHADGVPALTPEGIEASNAASRTAPQVIMPPRAEYGDDFRRFQGIPGVEVAANGRLWATWYGGGEGENHFNYVLLSTSGDGGETWDLSLVVDPDGKEVSPDVDLERLRRYHWAESPRESGPVRAFDPVLWMDPTGRLWLIWAQNSGGYWSTAATWAMTTTNAGDPKPEWSEPFYVADGIMMNKPSVLSTGEWLFPMAFWRQEGSSAVLATSDKGESWSFVGSATIPDPEHRNADEHMIAERSDGSLLMWVRTMYGIGETVSLDRGRTWEPVTKAQVEHPTARFHLSRLSSGNWLLVKHGPLDEDVSRRLLTAYLSRDEGRTWEGGLLLEERPCSYPDAAEAEDGTLYVIYDRSRRAHKEILLAAFTEEDVLAGKPVSGKTRLGLLVNKAWGANLRNYDLGSHEDGEPFIDSPAAVVEPVEGEVDSLKRGVVLFSDRDYTLHHLPPELVEKSFIRGPMGTIRARVVRDGVVTVLTPEPERNHNGSLTEALLEDGYFKADLPECSLFFGDANICTAYQKEVKRGDSIELGAWGILVF